MLKSQHIYAEFSAHIFNNADNSANILKIQQHQYHKLKNCQIRLKFDFRHPMERQIFGDGGGLDPALILALCPNLNINYTGHALFVILLWFKASATNSSFEIRELHFMHSFHFIVIEIETAVFSLLNWMDKFFHDG